MSGEWCLPMCFLFSSEFCAAVSVPRWEREQCLSEINTTQRERGERERQADSDGEREREKEGREGRINEDRTDKHKSDF